MQTYVELPFADGDYLFALNLPQLAELQEKRGVGFFTIYGRLLAGRYVIEGQVIGLPEQGHAFVEDIYEIIRLGLVGGKRGIVGGKEIEVSALLARQLVERYAHTAPLMETWTVAAAIAAAKMKGYDPGPKDEPGRDPALKDEPASEMDLTQKTPSSTAAF